MTPLQPPGRLANQEARGCSSL